MTKRKEFTFAILIFFALAIATESVSYLILTFSTTQIEDYVSEPGDQVLNAYYNVDDPVLGWRLPRAIDYQASIKKADGRVIYDVHYWIDQFGRRQIQNNQELFANHLLIFGDSLSFGTGLNDIDTIQALLSAEYKQTAIYNYSVHGYGANQVLMQLRDADLIKQVQQKNGIALYFFNPDHINRALGSSVTSWNFKSPSIISNGNELKYQGSILDNYPWRSKFLSLYTKLKNSSNFLRLIGLDFPLHYSDSDLELVAEMIFEACQQYQKKFDGQFYVVFHPLYRVLVEDTSYLKQLLEAKKVKVLAFDIIDSKDFYIPGEGHPTAKFNRYFTPMLIESLRKEQVTLN